MREGEISNESFSTSTSLSFRTVAPPTLTEGHVLVRGKLGRQGEIGPQLIKVDRLSSPGSTEGESPGHDKAKSYSEIEIYV
jgi:hypothetical protein